MRRTLVQDRAAQTDLISIWVFSFERWGERQADRYMAALESGMEQLAADPQRGIPREQIRTGYWSKRIEHHLVFYTFSDTELRVRRVLHEAMDPDRHL